MNVRLFRKRLLDWYRAHRRDFPWRRRPTFYRTLVAEFMMQQTRALQALPYYRRFLRRFPSMASLARAKPREVLKLWEGLGYYQRAVRLHDVARQFAGRRVRFQDLEGLPGIGDYTRSALGSLVFQKPLPTVDGNVRRVLSRLLALTALPESAQGDRLIRSRLEEWIPHHAPGLFNQAMMELGARVCTPRSPRCESCPISAWCQAFQKGDPEAYPRRRPRQPVPHRHIAAAVIRRRDGRYLIAQRPATGLLPNLWEFPGGKRESGETLAECCVREIREELGIRIEVLEKLERVRHAYSHLTVTLHFFACRHTSGRPRALGCQAFRWAAPAELARYAFPRANERVVRRLAQSAPARRS